MVTSWRGTLLLYAAAVGHEALAGARLPLPALGLASPGPPQDTGTSPSVGRFSLTFAPCGPEDACVQVSDTFNWAGAAWEVLLFPAGHAAAATSSSSVAASTAASDTYASAYLRLVEDHRRQPLPRSLSFSITARHAAPGTSSTTSSKAAAKADQPSVLASRVCASRRFALEPSSSRSWGFAKFCPRARLIDSSSSQSGSSPGRGASSIYPDNSPLVLDVELGPALPGQPQPLGLVNEGNTCYMNSLLQSLYHLGAFREGVLAAAAAASVSRSSATVELGRTFAMLSSSSSSGGSGAGRTAGLCRSLGVDVRLQEDAQEFKGFLMAELEESAGALGAALSAPFEGKLLNTLECPDVTFAKQWREPFVDMALEAGRGVRNLDQALQRYFAPETLEGSNAYKVPGVEAKQRAVKRVFLEQPPEVLHLQLKRFTYDPSTNSMRKINDKLSFDEEIDLSPYLAPPSNNKEKSPSSSSSSSSCAGAPVAEAKYRLHAVLMHAGAYGYGHYFSYVRPHQTDDVINHSSGSSGGGWYRLDDERVSSATLSEALKDGAGSGRGATSAYLLQYVRVDATPALLHTATSSAAAAFNPRESRANCAEQP